MGGGAGGGGFGNTQGSNTGGWGTGGTGNSYNNANKHYNKHGNEVGAKNFQDYLRKANAFKDTVLSKKIKGIHVSGKTPDVYRYNFNGKYIDLQKLSDGTYKIISYGKQ